MEIKSANAAQAYAKALAQAREAKDAPAAASDAAGAAPGGELGFADILQDTLHTTAQAVGGGETAAIKSVTGDAALTDIVTAVTAAEITLETVVAVRDRVIEAYQEIIRMPI